MQYWFQNLPKVDSVFFTVTNERAELTGIDVVMEGK